jgi:hypothetical protein
MAPRNPIAVAHRPKEKTDEQRRRAERPIEEWLREVLIGEIEPQTIVGVYDPAWPERFRQE